METRRRIRCAATACASRGLKVSAKWLNELLVSIDPAEFSVQRGDAGSVPQWMTKKSTTDPETEDLLQLVQSYMNMSEYTSVCNTIERSAEWKKIPEKRCKVLVFMRAYARYLLGEKRKEQELLEVTDPLERCDAKNKELQELCSELSHLRDSAAGLDAFGLYILGVVYKELDAKDKARKTLEACVRACPFIWTAWVDLATLCMDVDTLNSLRVGDHWMRDYFRTHALLELQQNEEAWQLCCSLERRFGRSSHLTTQMALVHYNLRRFDDAQELFEELIKENPHRLDSMDTYSNILYVKECRAELSDLAHRAVRNDKYRPETCCIIGNYYSLKGNHRKAVLYFKRALRLNRHFLSAWTLMGHEYVELKKTEAAIEAYRQAVDINPHDYRAWYGLGQTYEIHRMYFYALYYYRKACILRPYDARMWCALGGCYECLEKFDEAEKCYERAIANKDMEDIALIRLARLRRKRGALKGAAKLYEDHMKHRQRDANFDGPVEPPTEETVEALTFLAEHYKNLGSLDRAEKCCMELLDFVGSSSQKNSEALAIMREIRSLRSSRRET